jgi:hypothetical protein
MIKRYKYKQRSRRGAERLQRMSEEQRQQFDEEWEAEDIACPHKQSLE